MVVMDEIVKRDGSGRGWIMAVMKITKIAVLSERNERVDFYILAFRHDLAWQGRWSCVS